MLKHTLLYCILFCLASTAFAQQNIDQTMLYDGLVREYRIYLPEVYDGSQPASLLFNLHGYGSSNLQQLFYGDFRAIADTANIILCLPNGTPDGGGSLQWNSGFATGVDDVGFINALIDTLSEQFSINPARVYSTGMSNGGFMSLTLACESGNRIAAVASVTGTMTDYQVSTCEPYRPIPVMQIHGTADPTVPYAGGNGFLPIEDLVAYWVNNNGCNAVPTVTPLPNNNTTDGSTVERFDYGECDENTAVVFYKVTGGGHTWPGSIIMLPNTNRDFSASTAIWNFLRKYQHPDFAVPTATTITNAPQISVYPNPFTGSFKIELPNEGYVQISNTHGEIVFASPINNGTATLQLQTLPAGVYFINVRSSLGVLVKRVVKL